MTDPVVRQIDIARPAVVRIITSLGGSLAVRFTTTTGSVTFPQGGGTYTIRLSGSGAFVSAHGDILTADHVVNPPHDQQMDDALFQVAAADVSNYVNAHFQVTQPFTPEAALADLEAGIFPSTTNYGAASSDVYLSTDYTGQLVGTRIENLPSSVHVAVDRIEQQSSFNDRDVAIIHVKGMDDMPSIQLGDSGGVQEQDPLTIIGFPGNGDISNSPTDFLTSSVNKIYVSALKTTDAGAPVIQVGGNVEHGDSGGPALDTNGNIVGIVSFSASDTGSTSFLQASNSAQDLIHQLGLDIRPGSFQSAWSQAIKDYASFAPGHWHKAQQELQALSGRYPQFAGATPYLSYAQNQATHERAPQTQTQPGPTSMLLPVGIGLIILAIVGILVVIMLRRGQSRRVSLAGAPGGAAVLSTSFAPSTTPPFTTPFPAQSGGGQYAAGASPLYASQHYINNMPGTLGNPSPAYIPPSTSLSAEETLKAGEYMPFASPEPPAFAASESSESSEAPVASTPPSNPSQADIQGHRSEPSWMSALSTPPPAPDTFMQKPAERVVNTPAPFADITPSQAEGQAEAEKTIQEPIPLSSWTFAVPRRPGISQAASEVDRGNTYGQSLWVAPCGHLNTRDVRFCRVCGKAAGTSETPSGTDER